VVLEALAVGVGQAGEPSHGHAAGQVEVLDMRSVNPVPIWVAELGPRLGPRVPLLACPAVYSLAPALWSP
jgi:hypothetical protein